LADADNFVFHGDSGVRQIGSIDFSFRSKKIEKVFLEKIRRAKAGSFQRRYQLALARTSKPQTNAVSSSGRNEVLDCSLTGQLNRPRSSRFARTQSPLPSQHRILSRLRRRLVKTNQWPDKGSWARTWGTDDAYDILTLVAADLLHFPRRFTSAGADAGVTKR